MYRDIHKLPFVVFREIILEGDLSLLGVPEDEKATLWEEILAQYAEAIGEKDEDGYLSDRRELLYYETQRILVDELVELIKTLLESGVFANKWAKLLGRIVRMEIKWKGDIEDLHNQLNKALTRSIGIIDINLDALREKVSHHKKENEGEALKPTREYFAKLLLNLREFISWQFDEEKISTFQYCEMLRRFMQHQEYLKQNNSGRNT